MFFILLKFRVMVIFFIFPSFDNIFFSIICINADNFEKEETFNAAYNSFDGDEIDKRLWQGMERIMFAWASDGEMHGERFPGFWSLTFS